MKDFTLKAYEQYLTAIKQKGLTFYRFDEFIGNQPKLDNYCLVRHDVDRLPQRSLDMALLENKLGVKATYYFRAKPCSFDVSIMKKIADLGHEVGYHYESLSDTDGNIDAAVVDFEKQLQEYKKIASIKTCSMHGRPFKPYDNRDIWRVKENHDYLKNNLGLLGEVYLDIDYTDIAYINDTGRNWTSGASNRRDKVNSSIVADFQSGEELLSYLQNKPHNKICFQIHPERWTDDSVGWAVQSFKDFGINCMKKIINILRK